MQLQYSIKHEDSIVLVRVTGSPDYLSLDQLWRDIIAYARENGCQKILGQSASEPWPDADAYDHAAIFEAAGVSNQYRIAWVEQTAGSKEPLKLAQAVVNNRGFETAQAFDSVADAKRWLAKTDSAR